MKLSKVEIKMSFTQTNIFKVSDSYYLSYLSTKLDMDQDCQAGLKLISS